LCLIEANKFQKSKMMKAKVLDFANKLCMKKRGSNNEITPDRPEYKILDFVLTDEMAEVGLCLEIHRRMSAEEVAPLCGKSIKETSRLLWELAIAGVAFVHKIAGIDKYWIERWVPGHMGAQEYMKLASQGRYEEALELIKNENPFPAVCGRVCPGYFASACTGPDTEDPVAIDAIKKFIADQDLHNEHHYVPKLRHHYGKNIAVIGAGPAGLSCAYYLAIDGYKVTVFEKKKALGGMLTSGIPSFRLEKEVIHTEIDVLKELGIEFKTGVEVGKDVSLDYLRNQGFEAFYIAIGAQSGRSLGLAGEDAKGVLTGVDFLRKVAYDHGMKMEGNTLVIGGGNVAIDVARSATRVGSSKVDMYCLENREEMPALPEEIEEAMTEGIGIYNSWGPKRIMVENRHVVGVEFKKCISVINKDERFDPEFYENETKIVKADHVLNSAGQGIEWGKLTADSMMELNHNMTIKADAVSYQTGEPDVFVGGDVYSGPGFVIDAIAMGKEGAISIHRYVNHEQSLTSGRIKRDYRSMDKNHPVQGGYDRFPGQ